MLLHLCTLLTVARARLCVLQVATIVQMVVNCPESDPDVILILRSERELAASLKVELPAGPGSGLASPSADDEYIMPLPPHEAKLLDGSKQLSSVMRLAGVRLQVDRTSGDGWVSLTIRGSAASVENAKRRIEAIVDPSEDVSDLDVGGVGGGSTGGGRARAPHLAALEAGFLI